MISMTGYGYKEFQNGKVRLSLEMKTYNNRYMDLILNVPPPLSPLEGQIRSLVTGSLKRGRVEVYLRMKELEEDLTLIVDREAVKSYAATLREVQETAGIGGDLSLGHILSMDGIIKTDKNRDLDALYEIVEPLFQDVLEQVHASRAAEGAETEKDIMGQISFLEDCVSKITEYAPRMEEQITTTLKEKFAEVVEGKADESRILAEIAVQIVRFDINEELQRLTTHFEGFRSIADSSEPVGKKLDFLCQEINREVNTIGSKNTLVEIGRIVVEMKDSLEKVREQLRNVE
ncbi:MAG: YicC family protein [Spirochaetales bacterium]|nr:YicC family protein [Spirochaetales bacterium]